MIARATTSFYDITTKRVVSEGALFAADHPLVKRYPDSFGPVLVETADSRPGELRAVSIPKPAAKKPAAKKPAAKKPAAKKDQE